MEKLMKITSVQIKEDKGGVDTFITFDSMENLTMGTYLSIMYENKKHYFQINKISVYCDTLMITAKEVGYFASNFRKMPDFDLRKLVDLDITVITDDESIKKIREMSCWC